MQVFNVTKCFYLNQIKDNLLKATIPYYMYMTDLKGHGHGFVELLSSYRA